MYQILPSRSEGGFSARWYSLCTELYKFYQVAWKILVEIVSTRLIQRRVSFKDTSRRIVCKRELNPQLFLFERNVLTFWLLQIIAVCVFFGKEEYCERWSGWRDLNSRPFEWQSNALPTEPQPHMEAIFRIELKTKGYKALVLPLNYIATWSAWWGTIPQPAAWKAATLANWATRAFKWFLSQPCINIISRFSRKIKFSWYLRVESNHRPSGYESDALTIWAT